MLWRLLCLLSLSCLVVYAEGPSLRVLTFNIRHGQGTDDLVDADRVARVLETLAPDVVALQEVDRGTARVEGVDQVERLARATGWHAAFGSAMPYDGGHYGNAILSRFPLSEVETHSLPFREEQEPRATLVATVVPNNGLPPFRFVSTHFSHDREDVRIEQAGQVIHLLQDEKRPVILAGDMNARPASMPMERFWKASWQDQVAPESVIDYVLTREQDPWTLEEARIIDDTVTSDHRPVLVSLQWTGRRHARTDAAGFSGTLIVHGPTETASPMINAFAELLEEKDAMTARWLSGNVSFDEIERCRVLLEEGGIVAGPGALLRLIPGVRFELESDATLIVKGRRVWGIGEDQVKAILPASAFRPEKTIVLTKDRPGDVTALRRAVVERGRAPFPPDPGKDSRVPHGTLVLVGGGEVPAGVREAFFDAAGGEDARIAIIPIASPAPLPEENWLEKAARERGVEHVKVLSGRTPAEVDDAEALEFLERATGVWFGGGRQWRFVDAYEDTEALQAMHRVLERGGVIGGTSAGATIQAEYLARGNPLGNRDIMAEGYERGLGFLPSVAVDQHFQERDRFDDMTLLIGIYPQLLGVGLDESTALIVQGSLGKVMGKGKVHFYDGAKPGVEEGPGHESVSAGEAYDLTERKRVRPQ